MQVYILFVNQKNTYLHIQDAGNTKKTQKYFFGYWSRGYNRVSKAPFKGRRDFIGVFIFAVIVHLFYGFKKKNSSDTTNNVIFPFVRNFYTLLQLPVKYFSS